jgi:hypothetical protein
MNRILFKDRAEFRKWLTTNALSNEGVWLVFGKNGSVDTIKASEALEERCVSAGLMGRSRVSTTIHTLNISSSSRSLLPEIAG